jgi:hypothetical protein
MKGSSTTTLVHPSRELMPSAKVSNVKPVMIRIPPNQSILPSLLTLGLSFGMISVADTHTAIAEAAQR